MSISIKLMGVPGPKLMDEEKFTLDMFGVSTPTFVTPDVKSNAHLQNWSVKNAQIFHFVNFQQPHILDMIMQGLWIKTQSSPFEAPYFSCVPYLLGEGQAMQYSVWPKTEKKTPIPRLPLRPPDDYLRDAMVKALAEGDVEFDFRLQLQTDSFSCRSRTTACSGRRNSRHRFQWQPCVCRNRSSIRRHKWNLRGSSLTTPGIPSPSIVRWVIKAAPGSGCITSCLSCGMT